MTLFTGRPRSPDSPDDIYELLALLEWQARERLEAHRLPADLVYWLNNDAAREKLERRSEADYAVDVLLECRNVRAAIRAGDAALAAWNTAALKTTVANANLDGYEKPIRAGIGTMKGGGQRPPRYTESRITSELDRQFAKHPHWGITALRTAAGESLPEKLSERQIRRITKYDPRK